MRRLAVVLLPAALFAMPVQAQFAPAGTFGALPAATFGGTGIPNTSVMKNTFNGVTIALTATGRFSSPTVTDNGAGTYYATTGFDAPGLAKWNFDFYIAGALAGAYNYKLYYDFDPSVNTLTADLGSVVGNSANQDSWNLGMPFLSLNTFPWDAPTGTFNANASGEYNFALLQYDVTGHEVGRVAIMVDVATVPEPASLVLVGSGLLGLAAVARRRKSA